MTMTMTGPGSRRARNTSNCRSIGLLVLGLALAPPAFATPEWIEHASSPGPDVPPVGQSRFDDLFRGADSGYRLPYPFPSLIEDLESRLDTSSGAGVRQIFVPLGRSLQRDAAAPHYFRDSRQVITLEGEPRTRQADAGRVLEYRLFVAHQPTTQTLEVISYNDEAGRFEFQVVENYDGRQAPRVRQASRAMCLSCHQNAAPIFALRPWSETSFNVRIARHLIEARPDEFSSLIDLVTFDADLIDVLVERANYLSAAQHIWRFGCPHSSCRAALLRAVLQYRLSGEASFDAQDADYRENYYRALEQNWSRNWPAGLALANHHIPDRDPFSEATPDMALDPLFDREAYAEWYAVDDVLAGGIVYRLAGFLTLADIRRLDQHLVANHDRNPGTSTKLNAPCRVEPGGDDRRTLVCVSQASSGELRAQIEIEGAATIDWLGIAALRVPGDRNLWQPEVARLVESDRAIEIITGTSKTGLSARFSDGRRIHALRIVDHDSGQPSLELEIVDDSERIDAAIAALLLDDDDSLSSAAFRRDRVMPALMRELQMPALSWPRAAPAAKPQAPNPGARLEDNLALLDPYCAHCHAQDTHNPPGFLYGVNAGERVVQCAPRMLARLAGWQSYPQLARSPMPPPASLPVSGTSAERWPDSDHYRSLLAAITALLERDYSDIAYEDLPACGPGG